MDLTLEYNELLRKHGGDSQHKNVRAFRERHSRDKQFQERAAKLDQLFFVARLEKLPAWARAHISHIERQRDEAVKRYNDFLDNETKSHIYAEDINTHGLDGPNKSVRYIQAYNVSCESKDGNVKVQVYPKDDAIDIFFHCGKHQAAALQPCASNVIRIVPHGS